MEVYATKSRGCAGRAKSTPEDFQVEEYLGLPVVHPSDSPGLYPLYKVEKRGIDTMHMERALSGRLNSRVSFGGMKDSRAVATQYATPTSRNSLRPIRVEEDRYTAERIGFVESPITRTHNIGNRFRIVLRGCCEEVGDRIGETFASASERKLPNFFGLQRFGTRGGRTHLVGRAMVRGDFKGAAETILWGGRGDSPPEVKEALDMLASGDFVGGSKLLPPGMDIERMVADRLARKPGDYLGALRAVPIKLRRLYPQAYQSFIFNRTLSLALIEGSDISTAVAGDNWNGTGPDGFLAGNVHGAKEAPLEGAVPMVQLAGFAFRDYGSRLDVFSRKVMEDEGVSPRDFYLKDMQEVSAEGGFRVPHLTVRDESYAVLGSDATLDFALGKGQFATVLLREVLKPDDPASSGLA